jgi:GT2 family glycosyltransferase
MTAIIILNWNGADDTIFCLDSLKTVIGDFIVIVVDNGSNDDSVKRLKEYIPTSPLRIHLLEFDSNYGFAKGNNLAIAFASKFNPDSYLLLNNDTEVTPDFLKRIVDFSVNNSRYRALTPQIRYSDKYKIWNCGGKLLFGMHYYYFAEKNCDIIPKTKRYINISYITGCCLFFYPDLLSEDGKIFTERFFFGEEDFDFSLRMKRDKIKMACVLDSVIYHKQNSSSSNMNNLGKTYMQYLNRFIDIKLNIGRAGFLLWKIINLPFVLINFYKLTSSVYKVLYLYRKLKLDIIKKDAVSYSDFRSLVIKENYFVDNETKD